MYALVCEPLPPPPPPKPPILSPKICSCRSLCCTMHSHTFPYHHRLIFIHLQCWELSGPYRAMRAAMRCERRCVLNTQKAMRCNTKILAMCFLAAEIHPKGPSRTKNSSESKFSTGSKFATAVAKRYGECSEMLVFLGRRGRKTVRILKNYGGGKIVRIQGPYYFQYGRVLWVRKWPENEWPENDRFRIFSVFFSYFRGPTRGGGFRDFFVFPGLRGF